MLAPCVVRNITGAYMKARRDKKKKVNRFGPSLLDTASISTRASIEGEQYLLGNASQSHATSSISDNNHNELPPVWQEKVEGIQESIKDLERCMANLAHKQNQYVLKVFGSENNTSFEIDDLTADVQRKFQKIEIEIKLIFNDQMDITNAEACLRSNAQKGLSSTLQKMTLTFKAQQKKYGIAFEKKQGGESLLEEVTRDANYAETSFFTDHQLMELEHVEKEATQRNKEIAQIARSMRELNGMFKELSTMVIEQGTVLDRIDFNIENTLQFAEQARQELTVAEKAQRNSRVDKCLTFLICAIAVQILILMCKVIF